MGEREVYLPKALLGIGGMVFEKNLILKQKDVKMPVKRGNRLAHVPRECAIGEVAFCGVLRSRYATGEGTRVYATRNIQRRGKKKG